jgi:hypothetical protein
LHKSRHLDRRAFHKVAGGALLGAVALSNTAFAKAAVGTSKRADFRTLCGLMRGRWVGELICMADWPGVGKKGDKLFAHGLVSVVSDGSGLWDQYFIGNGSHSALIVFDEGAREIRCLSVSTGGGVEQSLFSYKNRKWLHSGTGSAPDGMRYDFTDDIALSDNDNTQTWTRKTMIEGKFVGEHTDVWRRVYDGDLFLPSRGIVLRDDD